MILYKLTVLVTQREWRGNITMSRHMHRRDDKGRLLSSMVDVGPTVSCHRLKRDSGLVVLGLASCPMRYLAPCRPAPLRPS